jgi:hypothetical protein
MENFPSPIREKRLLKNGLTTLIIEGLVEAGLENWAGSIKACRTESAIRFSGSWELETSFRVRDFCRTSATPKFDPTSFRLRRPPQTCPQLIAPRVARLTLVILAIDGVPAWAMIIRNSVCSRSIMVSMPSCPNDARAQA